MMECKFTDDEIVKAVKCCYFLHTGCICCPFNGVAGCMNESGEAILDLINRQKAEIADERARKELCAEVIKRLDKENETARAEAIKEFAERLRAKSEYGTINVSPWQIDNLVKEMTGENNNE